jgi:exonuclease SbcC
LISRIRLRNWKSHLESEFEFSQGVNALIGIMGSGKTSIMQAIAFGLYGTFPALQARRASLDDLIMKKPQVMNEAEVYLEFALGDRKYSVLRVIQREKGTVKAELRQEGRLVETSAQGVTREVGSILDMDYELFSKAVYSEQNAIDYFLRIPRGQRMDHIDRMLRLDRFEKAREGAVSLSNRLRQSREERLRLLSDLRKEGLPERISGIRKELEGLGKEQEVAGASLKKSRKRVSGIEERVTDFEDLESEMNQIQRELEGIQAGMAQIDESVKQKSGRLEGVERTSINARLGLAEKAVKELGIAIEASRESIEQGREGMASVNTELRLLNEGLEEIHNLGGQCPVCESDITPAKKRELVHARKIRETELGQALAKQESGIRESGQALDALNERMEKRVEELESLKSVMNDIGFLEDLAKRRREYGKRQVTIQSREKKLSARLKGLDIGKLREELKQAVSGEGELRTRLEAYGQRIRDREEMLAELRSREELMIRYNQESMQDQEIMEKLARFVNVVRLTQDQLREEFLKSVNSTMDAIWGELYPYQDFTGIRLSIDRDYILQLRENGSWVNVEGLASGGERTQPQVAHP